MEQSQEMMRIRECLGENAYPIYRVCVCYSENVTEENREFGEEFHRIRDGRFITLNWCNHHMYEAEKVVEEIEGEERKEVKP